jgi:plastocyanin
VDAPAAAVRRVANRYLGEGGSAPRAVQRIPTVAYLDGPGTTDGGPARVRPRVEQRDTTFVPAVVVVPPGAVVEFPNEDPFFHNVFSYSAVKRFDLGRYPKGESKSVGFSEPGIVKVYCEVHEFMRAVVIVTPSRFHAIVGADGRFVIPDVPPGSYTLVVWRPDREGRLPVFVRPGAPTRVTVALPGIHRSSR